MKIIEPEEDCYQHWYRGTCNKDDRYYINDFKMKFSKHTGMKSILLCYSLLLQTCG